MHKTSGSISRAAQCLVTYVNPGEVETQGQEIQESKASLGYLKPSGSKTKGGRREGRKERRRKKRKKKGKRKGRKKTNERK